MPFYEHVFLARQDLTTAQVELLSAAQVAALTTTKGGFWYAAAIAGVCMGSSQSAGRAMAGMLAPPAQLAEFFGLWTFATRVASIVGPLTYGAITWATDGNHRLAILSTAVLALAATPAVAQGDEASDWPAPYKGGRDLLFRLRERQHLRRLCRHGVGGLLGHEAPHDGHGLGKTRRLARRGVAELAFGVLGRLLVGACRQGGAGKNAVGHGDQDGEEDEGSEHGIALPEITLHSVVHFFKK
mgnify:CR=1 FL=1